ncbi:hypothetical protein [Algicola sagamiensis]|uniref:hypothetical protein n=1 Tax=Algicola sagamiensis TaxID=163869 RepID=UPI00037854FD|nr:hypothetical protein [Algicola sagamiensis]
MSEVKIGWFSVEEVFIVGDIDVAIRDRRNNDVIAFRVDSLEGLEQYNQLIELLLHHQEMGVLKELDLAI